DVVEVGADGRRRQLERVGDLRDGLAAGELEEDFELALRQRFQRAAVAVEVLHRHALGDLRVEVAAALGGGADGIDQRLGRAAFAEIAERPSLEYPLWMTGVLVGRQREDAGA